METETETLSGEILKLDNEVAEMKDGEITGLTVTVLRETGSNYEKRDVEFDVNNRGYTLKSVSPPSFSGDFCVYERVTIEIIEHAFKIVTSLYDTRFVTIDMERDGEEYTVISEKAEMDKGEISSVMLKIGTRMVDKTGVKPKPVCVTFTESNGLFKFESMKVRDELRCETKFTGRELAVLQFAVDSFIQMYDCDVGAEDVLTL